MTRDTLSDQPRKPMTEAYAELAEQKYPGNPQERFNTRSTTCVSVWVSWQRKFTLSIG
jgi:hypothetical protein